MSGQSFANGVTITFSNVAVCQCGCRDPHNIVINREELTRLLTKAQMVNGTEVGVPEDFLRDVLRLAHPDLHIPERRERATRVSAVCTRLLSMRRQKP